MSTYLQMIPVINGKKDREGYRTDFEESEYVNVDFKAKSWLWELITLSGNKNEWLVSEPALKKSSATLFIVGFRHEFFTNGTREEFHLRVIGKNSKTSLKSNWDSQKLAVGNHTVCQPAKNEENEQKLQSFKLSIISHLSFICFIYQSHGMEPKWAKNYSSGFAAV